LDLLQANRATLEVSLEAALALAEQHSRNAFLGQNDLFGLDLVPEDNQTGNYTEVEEWSEERRLALEKETLGLYLSGHPIDHHEQELRQIAPLRIAEIIGQASSGQSRNQRVIIAGLIGSIRTNKARQGGRNAFITLDDRSARLEVKTFTEVFDKYRELLKPDHIVVIEGTLGWDSYTDSAAVMAEKIHNIAEAREIFAKILEIGVDGTYVGKEIIAELARVLAPFRQGGGCPVAICYRNRVARARLMLGKEWHVQPNKVLLSHLQSLPGTEHVRIRY
jgi:DNA polymerase-3 subunit alpha